MTLLAIHHFNYLLFRQHPQLPINLIFNFYLLTEHQSYPQYVSTWKTAMENAYKLASKKSQESGARLRNIMTRNYAVLSCNPMTASWYIAYHNEVALASYEHTGKTKYTVLSDKEALTHLYTRLKPETGTGPTHVLHRNLLQPCDSLPVDSGLPKQESKWVPSRRQRQFKCQLHLRSQAVQKPVNEEGSSDEDNDIIAYKLASKKHLESGAKAKKYYDQKLCSTILQLNDRILVHNLSQWGGPGKLKAHWEDQVHCTVRHRGLDSSVYKVKPETGTGPTHVLHWNLLLPCDSLRVDSDLPKQESKRVSSRRQRQFKCQLPSHLRPQAVQKPVDEEGSYDEDNDTVAVSRPTRPTENSPCSAPFGATSEPEVTPEQDIDSVPNAEPPETVENQQISEEVTSNQVRPCQNEHMEPGAALEQMYHLNLNMLFLTTLHLPLHPLMYLNQPMNHWNHCQNLILHVVKTVWKEYVVDQPV